MNELTSLDVVLYLVAGAALGTFYFTLLRHAARLHAAEAGGMRILPLYLVRFGAAIAVFWTVAQRGAWPLLLALAGFVIARLIVQYRVGTA